jgi:hypothetical protein
MKTKQKRRAPTPAELVLVDALLTVIDRRMRGALDLGLVLLLEAPAAKYLAYVTDHVAAPMRAAALLLRLQVAEVAESPALTPFEAIATETEKFALAMAELAGFASLTGEQLRAAVDKLAASFRRISDTLLDVAERLCFEPAVAAEAPADRDGMYHDILDRLHADLEVERGVAPQGS